MHHPLLPLLPYLLLVIHLALLHGCGCGGCWCWCWVLGVHVVVDGVTSWNTWTRSHIIDLHMTDWPMCIPKTYINSCKISSTLRLTSIIIVKLIQLRILLDSNRNFSPRNHLDFHRTQKFLLESDWNLNGIFLEFGWEKLHIAWEIFQSGSNIPIGFQ